MKLTEQVEREYRSIAETSMQKIFTAKKTPAIEKIISVWHENCENERNVDSQLATLDLEFYRIHNRLQIAKIEYTPNDITSFCFFEKELKENKLFIQYKDAYAGVLGMFLSALIAHHNKKNQSAQYRIITEHVEPLHFIGYENTAHVEIYGNVGNKLGEEMKEGIIRVHGNSANLTGHYLHGGEIHIDGSAENLLGMSMQGGKIKVSKNAGGDLGSMIRSGEIHIDGEIKSISKDILSLRYSSDPILIYNKGKIILEVNQCI